MNQLEKDKEFFLNSHKLSTKTPIKLLNKASFEGVSCFGGGCGKEVPEDYVRGSVVLREGIVFFDCVRGLLQKLPLAQSSPRKS